MTSDHLTPSGEIPVPKPGITDDRLARELDMAFMYVDPMPHHHEEMARVTKRQWLAVARRARELLGGKTPEEQAVIEAAPAIADWLDARLRIQDYEPSQDQFAEFIVRVRALRASRQATPRFIVRDERPDYTVVDTKFENHWCRTLWKEGAERIARLLNEADKP